jgi:hypothetical protein
VILQEICILQIDGDFRMTLAVQATEFCRRFASFQRRAGEQPIEVRNHGETTGYFVSPREFQNYQRLLAESRRAVHPTELPDHLREAVAAATVGSEHDHLNALLDD